MNIKIIAFFAFCGLVYSAPSGRSFQKANEPNCGYKSCHPVKDGMINVHIVPHTHDDVGWLKTVDEYYYGYRNDIQNAGVQYILDTVVQSLAKDKNRRFIYVELAFFWKWWLDQNENTRNQVIDFVNNGQLEFIGGAWSMNDEAVTNYHSTVDQFTWGLRKLNDTFGACGRPKIGWQIDPFGHSREQASIFAQLGFDGFLFGRLDYQDKDFRKNSKTLEMIWRGSDNLGEDSDIFTGILYDGYGPPPGFCFDWTCNDDPIIDNPKSPDYNVDKRVDDFLAYIDNMAKVYATSNVLVTMGSDFHYKNAEMWFNNLDKLIRYSNERQASGSNYNLMYSTPSCYVKAVYDETKGKSGFSLKQDDFFPYASDPHGYWTGYFTSRPTVKRFEREGNNFLQICKHLHTLADLDQIENADLSTLREAMGVLQHHDAVTGTEKAHVTYDYERLLQIGLDECQVIASAGLDKIIGSNVNQAKDRKDDSVTYQSCLLTNISSCAISEGGSPFVVTVYNPLSRPVNKYIRLPVSGSAYKVTGPDGSDIETQMIPIADYIQNIPGRESQSKIELIFLATDLPALGFKSYFIEQQEGNKILKPSKKLECKFDNIAFEADDASNLLSSITINNITLPVSQEFLYYYGFVGDNSASEKRASGAYIFRPTTNTSNTITDTVKMTSYNGNLICEIQQTFNEWASQTIRIYNKENYVEFDWVVGPLPRTGDNGIEVISHFKTGLASNGTFYTDSNGREMLKRIRDFRPTWNLEVEEPISGNYYPVTSKIVLQDEDQGVELAILTDRAEGGSSVKDGELELMVNRICFHDDALGVGEALMEEVFNQSLVARGSHYLTFGSTQRSTGGKSIAAQERDIAQRQLLSAWTFLSTPIEKDFDSYKKTHKLEFSGLSNALPDNVQILTLEPWKDSSILIRLEHVLEKGEDSNLSSPVTVNLKNILAQYEITSFEETTLAANQWLKDNDRLQFDIDGKLEDLVQPVNKKQEQAREKWRKNVRFLDTYIKAEIPKDEFDITLEPMQIRTFVAEISK